MDKNVKSIIWGKGFKVNLFMLKGHFLKVNRYFIAFCKQVYLFVNAGQDLWQHYSGPAACATRINILERISWLLIYRPRKDGQLSWLVTCSAWPDRLWI